MLTKNTTISKQHKREKGLVDQNVHQHRTVGTHGEGMECERQRQKRPASSSRTTPAQSEKWACWHETWRQASRISECSALFPQGTVVTGTAPIKVPVLDFLSSAADLLFINAAEHGSNKPNSATVCITLCASSISRTGSDAFPRWWRLESASGTCAHHWRQVHRGRWMEQESSQQWRVGWSVMRCHRPVCHDNLCPAKCHLVLGSLVAHRRGRVLWPVCAAMSCRVALAHAFRGRCQGAYCGGSNAAW